jgi:hypothetical protein
LSLPPLVCQPGARHRTSRHTWGLLVAARSSPRSTVTATCSSRGCGVGTSAVRTLAFWIIATNRRLAVDSSTSSTMNSPAWSSRLSCSSTSGCKRYVTNIEDIVGPRVGPSAVRRGCAALPRVGSQCSSAGSTHGAPSRSSAALPVSATSNPSSSESPLDANARASRDG